MDIEWPLVLFTALSGCGGWTCACIAAAEFNDKSKKIAFFSSVVAFIIVAVGGICSIFHLSHPMRVLNALNHPTSGIFIEIVLIGLTLVGLLVFMIIVRRGASATPRKVVAIITGVIGLALTFMAGHSYVMSTVEAWNTQFLPLGYLATAAPSGVALYLLLTAIRGDKELLKTGAIVLLCAGIFSAIFTAIYGLYCATLSAILVLWIAVFLIGSIGSIVFALLLRRMPQHATVLISIALACALIGCFAFRCTMWLAGDKPPDFFGVFTGV